MSPKLSHLLISRIERPERFPALNRTSSLRRQTLGLRNLFLPILMRPSVAEAASIQRFRIEKPVTALLPY